MSGGGLAAIEVLILDDDDYQRNVLHKMLTAIGVLQVRHAASVAAALEIAAEAREQVQVVISDLDIPDVDGIEFLRLLADQKPGAAVLIVSGKHESILRSVQLMAKEYGLSVLGALSKPATLPALRDKLSSFLRRPKASAQGGWAALSADDVAKGLELGQFEPFFQPKVMLESGRVCGAEALARWKHPERGVLLPGMFIGLAEQHGLIDQLTWAMLGKSATQNRRWSDAGLDISVSVNFSQTSLADTRLASRVVELVSEHAMLPERLIVEITETVVMTNVAHCLETLSRLRMKGFGLSIDDFGTGHSSLQQLSRVPYTELKIDQAFVTGAVTQLHLRAVLESSIEIARKLKLTCVGEGIETLEDWNCLKQLGCDIGQGYFIARPMEGARLLDWVGNWDRRASAT
jgi:EAL domain-containing protein (putative c-di-GMP-specific phosphodiesterase class I)/ActR/RegA family two-component response regulator